LALATVHQCGDISRRKGERRVEFGDCTDEIAAHGSNQNTAIDEDGRIEAPATGAFVTIGEGGVGLAESMMRDGAPIE
jgi:hypothetical protein